MRRVGIQGITNLGGGGIRFDFVGAAGPQIFGDMDEARAYILQEIDQREGEIAQLIATSVTVANGDGMIFPSAITVDIATGHVSVEAGKDLTA